MGGHGNTPFDSEGKKYNLNLKHVRHISNILMPLNSSKALYA
jgi:hypothetical protein